MNLLDTTAGLGAAPQTRRDNGAGAAPPADPSASPAGHPPSGPAVAVAAKASEANGPSPSAETIYSPPAVTAARLDPRLFQIAVLGSLLVYGMGWLGLDVEPGRALAILGTALLTQMVGTQITGGTRFDPKSALISGLSLCLLLRTNVPEFALVAAVVAVGSKFVIRVRGKHVFNPTNFAIVLMIALTGQVWVSPGQWGSVLVFAFLLASAGALVVNRAARADVTWTFLAAWITLLVGRSLWLGDPLTIPFHRLENGALVLFAFFMISDPRTTPDSRAGRILFAIMVAAGAYVVQFKLFTTNGLLWSLAVCSLAVPLIDRILPGPRYQWRPDSRPEPAHERTPSMKTIPAVVVLALVALLAVPSAALAFCGFYVAKADAKLFNRASQVVLARHDDKTVITMSADYRGELKEFAMVVPVPQVLERGQIRVADRALIEHLDAYTAPRLVEYFDENPCTSRVVPLASPRMSQTFSMEASAMRDRAKSLGVTIEAQYTVGEYDILILSAKESAGLETWLKDSGYRLPTGAGPVLGSYLKQGMKFFVARVNLAEQAKLGYSYLRPLQMAFETPKFMLPIRLGTLNADGYQEMFVYTLTKKGRVETTNYRTVPLPTGMELPPHVKEEFPNFYRAMFTEQVKKQDMRVVFLEYAWDMAWCDPCAADPLSNDQLRQLGVHWIGESASGPAIPGRRPPRMDPAAVDVFVTRLHVRYNEAKFPDDLVFQETANRSNFQGRYVLRHPWKGDETCEAAVRYRADLKARAEKEALALASLTGWPIEEIRKKMGALPAGTTPEDTRPWWKKLWPDNTDKQGKR